MVQKMHTHNGTKKHAHTVVQKSIHTQSDTKKHTHTVVQKSIHTQWYKKAYTHNGTKKHTHTMVQKMHTHNGTKTHAHTVVQKSIHTQSDTKKHTHTVVQKSIHTQWYKKAFTHNCTKKHTRKAFCVYFSTYANLIRPNGIRTDPPPGINLGTVQNEGFSRMFQVYTRAGFEGSLLPVFRNGRCNSGHWISATEPHRRDATS